METRTLRVLSGREEYPLPPDSDIGRIVRTYHAWRGEADAGGYEDVPGFCITATLDNIKRHGYVLTPGIYVGAAEVEDDGEPFDQKMQRLTAELNQRFAESDRIEARIKANLRVLGYGE
jgi:type I restriction enzyme M protein